MGTTTPGIPHIKVRSIGRSRTSKYGECRLCGTKGKLSKTHLPPKGAGNNQPARHVVQHVDGTGKATAALDRPRDGGMRGYWFCERCNQRTGRWDDEYIDVQRHLIFLMHGSDQSPRQYLGGILEDIDIGAFARSMWAWSFALNPTLRTQYPDLAAAVRTGDPVEPPSELELLLALTPSLHFWACAQPESLVIKDGGAQFHRRPSGLLVVGPQIEQLPITAVASPPFSVVLAHTNRPAGVPHVVTNDWLRDPGGARRDVPIMLPLIEVADECCVMPPSFSDFRPVPALFA
jgi:hypothetical protein